MIISVNLLVYFIYLLVYFLVDYPDGSIAININHNFRKNRARILSSEETVQNLDKFGNQQVANENCACVFHYLCDRNYNLITNGAGLIDERIGAEDPPTTRCTNPAQICCRIPAGVVVPSSQPPPVVSSGGTTASPATTRPVTSPSAAPPTTTPPATTAPSATTTPTATTARPSTSSASGTTASPATTARPATSAAPGTTAAPATTARSSSAGTPAANMTTAAPGTTAPPMTTAGVTIPITTRPSSVPTVPPPSTVTTPRPMTIPTVLPTTQGPVIFPNATTVSPAPATTPTTPRATNATAVTPPITPTTAPGTTARPPNATTTAKPTTPGAQCGVRFVQPDRVETAESYATSFGEFPWMLAVLDSTALNVDGTVVRNAFVAGASLITQDIALTGAHRLKNYTNPPINLIIRAGEWDTVVASERLPHQDRTVKRILIHQDFNMTTLYNDIALLKLEEPVVFANNVIPICIPKLNQVIPGPCVATGWGKNSFGTGGQYQRTMRKVTLPIVEKTQCQERLRNLTRLGFGFMLHESFMCAGGQLNLDTCTGDGGGPLACPLNGIYFQVGITSWGIGCGTSNVPGVYIDVSLFSEWINSAIRNLSTDTLPRFTSNKK